MARRKTPFICSKCGKPDKESHRGLCLSCYNKEYYREHRQEIINKSAEWAKNNPEKTRKIQRDGARRRWARLSPEEKTAKSREQEKRRSEHEIERRRAYYKTYYQRTKSTEHSKNVYRRAKESRRARENSVPNTLTLEQWRKIKQAYDYCCAYCGSKSPLTQDHVIPISKGGAHSADNVVPACQQCNRKKWDKLPPPDFVMKTVIFD